MNVGAPRWPGRSQHRGSPRTTAGMVLVCAGLAVSGWLGWEYWGTTWVAHRTQATVMSSIEDSWKRGKDSAVVPEGPGGGPVAFFFQAEDGIRDSSVTGVQTCALPI